MRRRKEARINQGSGDFGLPSIYLFLALYSLLIFLSLFYLSSRRGQAFFRVSRLVPSSYAAQRIKRPGTDVWLHTKYSRSTIPTFCVLFETPYPHYITIVSRLRRTQEAINAGLALRIHMNATKSSEISQFLQYYLW